MNYKVIDREKYYRKGVYRHFTEDCKCSVSMTARVDVTDLVKHSKETGTKFYINFLYLLSKTLNSRDDYRMQYLWQSDELICYDAGVFLQFVVIPVFEKLEKKMPRKPWLILCYVPAAIFALDIIASLIYRAVVK